MIPDYQSLMLPVLRYCSDREEARVSEAVEALADQLNLSEENRAELLPSGRQTTFANRVHWAKTYLTQAGLLESTRRGYFRITPRGRVALSSHQGRISNEYLLQFEEFRAFRARTSPVKTDDEPKGDSLLPSDDERTPDEIMRTAQRDIERALRKELLSRVMAAPPAFFEQLVVNLLVAMGYGGSVDEAGRAIGRSGDNGVDGVIDQDALGLDRVYIQAKRYAEGNAVGAGAIRDFAGSLDMHKATKGLFVTTADFTQDARNTADLLSRHIVLINGEQLAALMIRYDVGARVEETLYLKKIDEDFFPE